MYPCSNRFTEINRDLYGTGYQVAALANGRVTVTNEDGDELWESDSLGDALCDIRDNQRCST